MGCDARKPVPIPHQGGFNPRTHMGCDYSHPLSVLCHLCFNPRTHMGCDANCSGTSTQHRSFNPRTHMGCDCNHRPSGILRSSFNPRTHMGCDTPSPYSVREWMAFQSTHPHGVRLKGVEYGDCSEEFQSTHPHGVRPDHPGHSPTFNVVSIHAPTWGATFVFRIITTYFLCFNPRTHMGCDCVLMTKGISGRVSIHAPTWGATFETAFHSSSREFQSTHPHGVRRSYVMMF